MSFKFGAKSEANLVGIHPDLVRVVRLALTITDIDFSVHEGLRTLERQKKLVASGASRTLDSYHLTGDAVDLVPYVDGELRWEHPLCNQVAQAMHEACTRLHERLVWGRVWDMELEELDPEDLDEERAIYVRRYQRIHGAKKWPLDDGPHFQ
ncbi:MAG TPA: M15 family metallopeptidase, partial [Polyangiaceae bacterium]